MSQNNHDMILIDERVDEFVHGLSKTFAQQPMRDEVKRLWDFGQRLIGEAASTDDPKDAEQRRIGWYISMKAMLYEPSATIGAIRALQAELVQADSMVASFVEFIEMPNGVVPSAVATLEKVQQRRLPKGWIAGDSTPPPDDQPRHIFHSIDDIDLDLGPDGVLELLSFEDAEHKAIRKVSLKPKHALALATFFQLPGVMDIVNRAEIARQVKDEADFQEQRRIEREAGRE